MDSKRYSILQAPVMAFFSKDFYNDVATNWKGCGALYIFLLTTVAWLISCVAVFFPLASVMKNRDLNLFLDQIPHMTIQDSKLSIDKPLPYEIKDPSTGQVLALFATDRKSDTILDTDPTFVITSNAILTRETEESRKFSAAGKGETKDGVTTMIKFADVSKSIPKFEMDAKTLKELIGQVCLWLPVGVFFVAWPAIFLAHLFQLLIYGGIGMAIASGMEKKISFETGMRLASIAITPCIVIAVTLNLLVALVPSASAITGIWAFGSIAVALGYMFMELNSIKPPEVQQTSAGLR